MPAEGLGHDHRNILPGVMDSIVVEWEPVLGGSAGLPRPSAT